MDDISECPTKIKRLSQCMDEDGNISITKFAEFRSNMQKIKRNKAEDDDWYIDILKNIAHLSEESGLASDNIATPRHRSVFQRILNKFRNEDGTISIITPKMSSWYITYVLEPDIDCNKFHEKFRCRFRCTHNSYLNLLELVKSSNEFIRWLSCDALGRPASPIELLLLGAIRYLGRGWCFDDLEELTSISEECHRQFFHTFIKWGSSFLYKKYVVAPKTKEELATHIKEMEEAGLHGCIGSVDATHIGMLRCHYARWNHHKGPKEGCPARTYNIVVNHRRQILSSTTGHPGRWNDKTLITFDAFVMDVKNNKIFNDYIFHLKKRNTDNTVTEVKYHSAWFLCDNGYPSLACMVPPMKEPIFWKDCRFTEWLESMRKDVECTFGILKGRFRVLKTGIRLHGIEATDNIWLTCCALHNFLLEEDGLNANWESGISIWETPSYSNHSSADIHNHAPEYVRRHFSNVQIDLSGMGPGNDDQWNKGNTISTPTDSVGNVDELNQNVMDDNGNPDDTISTDGINVNSLTLEKFREQLIEHFDILFEEGDKLKWPSRLKKHKTRFEYNTFA
jgi:Plant transposon protein